MSSTSTSTRPPRELAEPGLFSSSDKIAYRAFWSSGAESEWQLFLRGDDFEAARGREETLAGTRCLPEQPGVYEFALVEADGRRRVAVYVGETNNLQRRHHKEYRGPAGAHLRAQFAGALAGGLEVWRRVRVVPSRAVAQAYQNAFLSTYDFAWNQVLNGARRQVAGTKKGTAARASKRA